MWPPPPELVRAYDSEMKKVRGEFAVNEGTKSVEFGKRSIGEASQPTTISVSTISEAQAAEIRAQVRQAINEGFAKARSKIAEVPKSGTTNPSPFVINLVTPSPFPQQVAKSGVLPASQSRSLVPLPKQGMEGTPPHSHACFLWGQTLHLFPKLLPPCTGSQKSLRASMDAARRTFTRGHPWCVTTLPLWEVVMPNKLPTQLPSCA